VTERDSHFSNRESVLQFRARTMNADKPMQGHGLVQAIA
jgi:hypothetical protein